MALQFITGENLRRPDNPTARGLAGAILRYGSINEIRAAAALPADSQRVMDAGVARAEREELVLVNDLIAAGLTRPLGDNWLAILELGWSEGNEVGHAQRTMVPKARGERQVPDQARRVIPIFCTWDDFSFDVRRLLNSQMIGQPLDNDVAEMATRNVNDAIEDQAWNGAGFTVHGNGAPGVLNAPNVNSTTYTGGEAWSVAGHTGEEIVGDVSAMIESSVNAGFSGPWNLYMPRNYSLKIDQDYKAAATTTTRQRLLEIDGLANLRVSTKLPANTTALIPMNRNVIDVIIGQTPRLVAWTDGPGWEYFFCVLAGVVVRVRSTYGNKSGIVIGTP